MYYMKRYSVIGAMALIIVLTACGAFTACGTDDTAVAGQGVTEQTADVSDITQAETAASDSDETSADVSDKADSANAEEENAADIADSTNIANVGESELTEEAENKEASPEAAEEADGEAQKADGGYIGIPADSTADGDIISISVGSDYLDCSVKYGNVKFLEDESTSDTLYFQGVSAGKDNIVISENGSDGVIFREYAVIVNDDLTVDLYPESNGIALLDGGYGINY